MNPATTTSSTRLLTAARFQMFLLLVIGLAAIYMVTYSGQIEIADQMQYYDATSSLAIFGDVKRDIAMWERMPVDFPRRAPDPLRVSEFERGLMLAGVPLYLLAEHVPGIGLVHTTYLLNVGVTALLVGVWFWIALAQGWRERTALIGALCLGLGTILLPYSQTYFREPLMILLLLLAVLVIEHRRNRPVSDRGNFFSRYLLPGALFAGLIAAAFGTKEATILALPGLLALLLPAGFWRQVAIRRVTDGLLVLIGLLLVLFAFTDLLTFISPRLQDVTLFGPFTLETGYTRTALHTYLFSPGGSLWGTSPLLLLALPGGWWLWRAGNRRLIWVVLLVLLGFVGGYALLRGEEWFGGTIWPQRFLLPVIPFVAFWLLPVLDRLLSPAPAGSAAPRHRLLWLLFGLLVIYSGWWQLVAVAFRWGEYSRVTYDLSAGGLAYWGPGFNDLRYIRLTMLTPLFGQVPLNFAWARTGVWWIPVLFGGLALLSLVAAWRQSGMTGARRILPRLPAVAGGVWLVLVAFTLRAIYPDPAYDGTNPALHEMLNVIQREIPPGELLLLADQEYNDFFLNYGKTGTVRVIGLPFHPGDRASCEQELRVVSENPADLLAAFTAPVIHQLADRQPRLWILYASGPDIPCVVRPLERYMGQHYYRISETGTSAAVRLLAYQTSDAPDPYAFQGADVPVNLHYTDTTAADPATIDLIGLTLPQGRAYHPGDWLPLSLFWQTETEIRRDYTVVWFVADTGGVRVQGQDSWFGATFAPSSRWTPGMPVPDHRALRLPDDLPPGEYQLWVKVYYRDPTTGTITDLAVSGAPVMDATVGVLPVSLQVSAPDA